jgi:uncharacterized protein YcaQ
MNGTISQKLARRLMLHAQMLDGRTTLPRGRAGVAEAVGHLGYVQIDTIAVIERAHHHTLWTRLPGYRPEHLHEAHAGERAVFEYWGHAASYLPMSDYRFYIPMMQSFHEPKGSWYRGWMEKYGACLEPVLRRIREEGPKAARDFENPGGRRQGPWWDWKPAKAALELLFWRGELMVRERRRFERVYDLTERVLPAGVDTRLPSGDELGRFIVCRALAALGVAGETEIRDYIRIGDRRIVAQALNDMLAAAEIVRLRAEGRQGAVFALPGALDQAAGLRARPPRVRLLSPFDNLAISRTRLKEGFAFDFKFECYLPKGDRDHGYFVLPILYGEEFVGRLDPKADRPGKTLLVRRLAIEPRRAGDERLLAELAAALRRFARFNGCERVALAEVRPGKVAAPLRRALAEGGDGGPRR